MTLDSFDLEVIARKVALAGGSWWPHEPSEQAGIDQKVWMAAIRSMRRCNGGAFFGKSALSPDPETSVNIQREATIKSFSGIVAGVCFLLLLLILGVLLLTSASQGSDFITAAIGRG